MHRVETSLGQSRLSIETGKLAKQANGAVVVAQGGTVVLVAVVIAKEPKRDSDFVPLTVDYREKTSAAGKIPGGFFKREGRPTEKEILTSRLIDRPIRPLFPQGFANEIQIAASVLSADGVYDPDVLAVIGASAAIAISDIPFVVPIAAVRVGSIDGQFLLNPTFEELSRSSIDLIVVADQHGALMIEAGAKEVPEPLLLDAIAAGLRACEPILAMQEQLRRDAGKAKVEIPLQLPPPELVAKVREEAAAKLDEINQVTVKDQRETSRDTLMRSLVSQYTVEGSSYTATDVKRAVEEIERAAVRRLILGRKKRTDGRDLRALRHIECEIGVLPRTHGSGLFTRGETQSLTTTTLGTSDDEQLVEALEGESRKRFMLHYNFPPFSVGEIRPMRGPGRREIGHGALAERALAPLLPSKEEFPYTVRVVSDILESNGSSSMATVCAGSLALMDAGVPLKRAVSGVAMGLVKEDNQEVVLTDIAGVEDHYGDMDFKIAGTATGVTALQMDIKLSQGISLGLIRQIVEQSHPARMEVLEKMAVAITAPRASISPFAPRIIVFKINPEKIRDVIGPGGKMIRKIILETGVKIDIEDDGSVAVASTDAAASEKAINIIKGLTADAEVGQVYTGKVKRMLPFGAFVEILPGKEGLVHISELDHRYVEKVEDVVKVGDELTVKVIEIDEQGRINLSRKALITPPPGVEGEERQGPPRGGHPVGHGTGGRPRRR